jgi:hypothetical protein
LSAAGIHYLTRKAELLRQLAVKSFVEANMRENITAEVAMELEDITVNSKKLGELVAEQVNAGTKKLQAKVTRLEQALPKNKSGAQPSSAAKEKNKTDQKTTPKKVKGKGNAQKADAAAKDSTSAKGKTPPGSNKKEKSKGNSNRNRRPRK